MKIGFAKMGLKTYFNENKSKTEGFNHELCDIFDIFEKRGHECVMLTTSDKYKKYEGADLDYIFLFNGPIPTLESGRKYLMFKNYSFPIIDFINSNEIPYVYFWTDPRYDIRENKLLNRKPEIILSQEMANYGHLDKLILYKKERQQIKDKDIFLGILMNDTNPKRSREILKTLNWLEYGEIIGNWKKPNKFCKNAINENKVNDYLSRVKYSYNLATNQNWVSQKYWEMVLNNVICFYKNYDNNNLLLGNKDYRRVKDEIDLQEKIENKDEELYEQIIKHQQLELKDDYFNGEFLYQFIIKKLEESKNEISVSGNQNDKVD